MTETTEAFATTAEKANQQVRAFGDSAAGTVRDAGNLLLDNYEKAVAAYLDLQQKAAEAAPLEVVKTAIEAHSTFVKEITDAYVKAARSALN